MRIAERYSHLNGLEFLQVHRPKIWQEIEAVIRQVNSTACKTKVSRERRRRGELLYEPGKLNRSFKKQLNAKGWQENRIRYWVTRGAQLIRKTLAMKPGEQKEAISKAGLEPIYSYKQTDFVKERVAIEVQFGKYAFVAYDLFVKHLAFYIGDEIDVGVEILPMKAMQQQMSSGIAYFEGELYNVIRQGRNVPAVPLVLIGIEG